MARLVRYSGAAPRLVSGLVEDSLVAESFVELVTASLAAVEAAWIAELGLPMTLVSVAPFPQGDLR